MTTTLQISLPVKNISLTISNGSVDTAAGSFTLGFDAGYIINNGKRYKIACHNGYEYIRKTLKGKRKCINAKALLALYLPEAE
jgi:hypothetical protein